MLYTIGRRKMCIRDRFMHLTHAIFRPNVQNTVAQPVPVIFKLVGYFSVRHPRMGIELQFQAVSRDGSKKLDYVYSWKVSSYK